MQITGGVFPAGEWDRTVLRNPQITDNNYDSRLPAASQSVIIAGIRTLTFLFRDGR